MRKIILTSAGLIIIASLTAGSWLSSNDEYDTKTWKDIQILSSQLAELTDKKGSALQITIWGDGNVWVHLKKGSSEITGKGSSPWAAAEDLLKQTGDMKEGINKILRPGS